MPGTALEKLLKANRWRVRTGKQASEDSAGWNGAFMVPLDGELYFIMISDGWGWKHLSVSNAQKKVLPAWGTMCRVKDLFFADDEWCVQFHPGKNDQINDHPYCLHLWAPIDVELPRPYFVMV